jgi:thiol-disulfide isomerase/thioredoxin
MAEGLPQRLVFGAVAVLAAMAGTALWLAQTPTARLAQPDIAPSVVFAAPFTDLQGRPRTLGEFQGKVLVLNFWATWCAPCREEMPAFSRLQTAWESRGVRFVGLSDEDPAKVGPFVKALGVAYPIWLGGNDVGELSRRLGNHASVLPHTVVFGRDGQVIAAKVGTYSESVLADVLTNAVANSAEK